MLLHRTGRLSTRCSNLRSRVQSGVACLVFVMAAGFWGAPAVQAQDADDYDRLMVEREALMAQVQEMRAMIDQMRAQMNRVREDAVSAEVEARNVQDFADARALEAQFAQRQAESHMKLLQEAELRARAEREMAMALADEAQAADHRAAMIAEELAMVQASENEQRALARQRQAELEAALTAAAFTGAERDALERKELEDLRSAASQLADAQEMSREEAIAAFLQASGQQRARDPWAGIAQVDDGRYVDSATGQSANGQSYGHLGAYSNGGPTLHESTLELVTRAIDLQGEIELAELEIKEVHMLAEKKLTSEFQVRQADVALSMLHRKYELVRALLVSELRATEAELSEAVQEFERSGGSSGRARLVRLESRLQILGSVVEIDRSEGGSAR